MQATHYRRFLLPAFTTVLLAGSMTAQAATIEVRSFEDEISARACTLRGAAKVINDGRTDLTNNACKIATNLSKAAFGVDDTIVFYASYIGQAVTLSSPVEIRKSVTITTGTNAPFQNAGLQTTLNGSGRNGILKFMDSSGTSASPFKIVVRNVNFTNAGPATTGGANAALFFQSPAESSSLLIQRSDFSDNRAEAIFAGNISNKTDITFRNTNFANNSADQSDSMIYLHGRAASGTMVNFNVTINDSTFTNNTAKRSPIYYTGAGILGIYRSTFSNNQSLNGEGGAIKIFGEPNIVTPKPVNLVNIAYSHFIGNKATRSSPTGASGGAIQSIYMKLNISDSSFIGNSAYDSGNFGSGGAIDASINHGIHTDNAINITRSTFAENIAGRINNPSSSARGGAISVSGNAWPYRDDWDTRMNISHSTFSDNYASEISGGTSMHANGISIHGVHLTLVNHNNIDGRTIRAVTAQPQANILLYNSLISGNGSQGHCAGNSGIPQTGATNLVWRNGAPDTSCGGLIANPSDPQPTIASLANNGGPTPTHELLPGSPAIDAGDPAYVMMYEPSYYGSGEWIPAKGDQRYFYRPQGDLPDIGAYETSAIGIR